MHRFLSHMYSLDYRLYRLYHTCTASIIYSTDVYHKCTAYIIYSTYFITNVQLTIYTAHILSQMYSLDYLFNRCDHKCTAWIIYSTDCITNVHIGLSTQQISSQMYILDYLLNRFNYKCTG
jgi:hypothetical protein